ncbi:MAG TPA: hypothetical protein VGO62_10265, partial [Myxococcota bacterium]
MELVEIVVQGLKGAPEAVRVPFAAGVTALPATVREKLYVRLVLDLLYPKGSEPTLADLDGGGDGKETRIGIIVVGRDQQKYRLLQDVHSGRRALQRMTGDKFEPITGAQNEIAQAVTATLGFPTEDVLRELVFCLREDLPSQHKAKSSPRSSSSSGPHAKAPSAKAEKPLPPGFSDEGDPVVDRAAKPLPPGFSDEGAPVVERGGKSDQQLRDRLAEVEELLRASDGVKDLEFELDGLQKKMFEIEAKLKPLATLKRSVEQAEAQLSRFHSVKEVPPDLPVKAERLQKSRAEHEVAVVRFEGEREKLVESSGTVNREGRQAPFEVAQKDPLVRYGAAAGAGAIALGLIGFVAYPPMQWVAFLDIPAFGVALFGGIRVLSSLEHGAGVGKRIERLDRERKKADDKLAKEEVVVKQALDAAGFAIEQLADVEEQVKARDEAELVLARTRA